MNEFKTSEKEFRVISEIDRNLNITQREISQRSKMSLGMTNIIMKRLINRGYIKVKQLNKKNFQYILTPKGFSKKVKQSYNSTLKTIQTFKMMKLKIQNFIIQEYKNGKKKFVIYGNGELANLIELSIRDLGKQDIVYIKINGNNVVLQNKMKNATVLLTGSNKSNNIKGVDVVSMLY